MTQKETVFCVPNDFWVGGGGGSWGKRNEFTDRREQGNVSTDSPLSLCQFVPTDPYIYIYIYIFSL